MCLVYTVLVAQVCTEPLSYASSLSSKLAEGASGTVCWLEEGLPCEYFLVPFDINIVAVTVDFLIASKLFLSQPEIFTFCASSPSCPCGKGERKAGERENGHGLESLSGSTEQGSTIPKPQQIPVPQTPGAPNVPRAPLIRAPKCFWLPMLLLPGVSSTQFSQCTMTGLQLQYQDHSS